MFTFFVLLFLVGTVTHVKPLINPTISNSSGEYWIASNDIRSFQNELIECTSPLCSIECDEINSCQRTTINSTNITYTISIYCSNTSSCSSIDILGQNTMTELNVNCNGDNACNDVRIYCPYSDRLCNIECSNINSCITSLISVEDKLYNNLNLNCNPLINTSCDQLQFSYKHRNGYTSNGATLSYNASIQSFYCDYNNYCPAAFRSTKFICASGMDCFINCTTSNCRGALFNAELATSLTLHCNSSSICHQSLIVCPSSDNSRCNIKCEGDSSCDDAIIESGKNANDNIFDILCTNDGSCNEISIVFNSIITNQATISCEDTFACELYIRIFNQLNVLTLNGNKEYAFLYSAATVDVMYDYLNVNMYINCIANSSCVNVDFIVNGLERVYLSCFGHNSCQLDIDVIESNYLDVYCTAPGSCGWMHVYANSALQNSLNIHCDTYQSCDSFYIRAQDDDNIDYLNISCSSSTFCDDYFSLKCPNKDGSVINYEQYDTNTNEWGCDQDIYFADWDGVGYNAHCCPFFIESVWDINCVGDIDCIYDCTHYQCDNTLINATLADSLTLECKNSTQCIHSDIICPKFGDCTIICSAEDACAGIKIYSESTTNTVSIECIYMDSCNWLEIHAPHIDNMNIKCEIADNWFQCCSRSDYCTNILVHVEETNNFTLSCIGSDTCHSFEIYANDAEYVSIYSNEINGFISNTLYALNAKHVEFICSSDEIDQSWTYKHYHEACAYNNYYLSALHPVIFNCYGDGCNNLGNLYVMNYSNITNIQFNVNLCGLENCVPAVKCATNISFYCQSNSSSFAYDLYSSTIGSGDNCISYGSLCGCNDIYSGMDVIDDQNGDRKCPNYRASPAPTMNPISTTTINQGGSSDSTAIIIIISVLVILFILLFIFFYRRKQSKKGNTSQKHESPPQQQVQVAPQRQIQYNQQYINPNPMHPQPQIVTVPVVKMVEMPHNAQYGHGQIQYQQMAVDPQPNAPNAPGENNVEMMDGGEGIEGEGFTHQ